MVQAVWGCGHLDVPKSLDEVQVDAKKFNLETFGNISHRKMVLEARIQGIHGCLNGGFFAFGFIGKGVTRGVYYYFKAGRITLVLEISGELGEIW